MGLKLFLISLLLTISCLTYGQAGKTAIVKGKLLNSATRSPFTDLKISIPVLNVFTSSDGEGNFVISEVPFGAQTLIVSSFDAQSDTLRITVDKDIVDLGDISIRPSDKAASSVNNDIPTITIDDNNSTASEDDGVSAQNASGVLASGTDPFLRTVATLFGLHNYHYRGYVNEPHEFQVNGVSLNDLQTNASSWTQMGRLYDIFYQRNTVYGLKPSSFTFGSVNGSAYYDATAANQQAYTKVSFTLTDRNYTNGLMLTHNSGLMKSGWAYSVSFAKRWAQNGYVPGTFYDDYSYYAGASKQMNKGRLNISTFGSPIDHGKAGSATHELYDLAGTNYYNRNWGELNGEKVNARVEKYFRPVTIVNYEYKPTDKTRWNTAIGYEAGKDKNSFLDGYNSSSPYGDYYRNLPSYYYTFFPPDTATGKAVDKAIRADPGKLQIDWNRMYQDNYINTQTINNVHGIPGNNVTGRLSEYILANRVNDMRKFTFNTNIEHALTEKITLYGGLTFVSQRDEYYNQAVNLLGGDFFVNYNQFASQQYIGNPNYNQNNLNDPNAIIKVGDKYGYDYAIQSFNTLLWGQAVYTIDKFDFFAAVKGTDNSFDRDGFMRNGLFPNNSYGLTPSQSFLTGAVKAGVNYKFDARNILFLNAGYTSSPPSPDNTYVSAAIRDFTVTNPTAQHTKSLEAGYVAKASNLSVRVVGYLNDITNQTEIKRFYNDDPAFQTFVNYVMQGENTRSIGTELAVEYKVSRQVSVVGVASIGKAIYTNNPNISVYLDNDTLQHAIPDKAYIKNYYLSAGSQTTCVAGINYHPKRDFYVNVNFNYFDRNYVEINPNRRTIAATGLYPVGSPQWHEVLDQEELPAAFTVDLKAGKKFQLSRMSKAVSRHSKNAVLDVYGSIGNLLNNTNVINSGYEQLRFDYTYHNPDKFANKYIYAYGINYSITVSLKF